MCHYCGSARPVPANCPRCGGAAYEPIGAGTERVEERVIEAFPGVAVDVLDRDAARRVGGAAAVLERFGSGRTRILVGTQMVAKGHHFPNVSLTAVLAADSYLGFPDFRAVERTYSMLTQLAGRAGRGIGRAASSSRPTFPTTTPSARRWRRTTPGSPPRRCAFAACSTIRPTRAWCSSWCAGAIAARPRRAPTRCSARSTRIALSEEVRISGPAPAPLERLQGQWRFQILLRHASASRLRRLIAESLPAGERGDVLIDVDPQDLF